MSNTKQFVHHAMYAAGFAAVGLVFTFLTHAVVEPQITHSQVASSTFIIQQTITAESSFLVEPADVTMAGSINGLTGGQATGTTDFTILTNNASGYYVDISFFDNGTEEAMNSVSGDDSIRDYGGDVAGEPSYGFTASSAAQFAYTVTSNNTTDTDPSFFNNGAACNTGGLQTVPCWKSPTTSAFRIVEKNSASVTGATSTITFSVAVPSGASPVPVSETYTATATLSLYNL